TREIAQEAASLVQVEYEDLPLVTLENALDDDAPILHPEIGSYKILGGGKLPKTSHPNQCGYSVVEKAETGASLQAGFARADHVFEHRFSTAREFQGFIEPRACVVWIDDDERIRVINTNKSPAAVRQQLATALDMPESQIVLDTTFIGGDFGGKGLSIDE